MEVPSYRKEIRKNTLKSVARLLSDYYQAINKEINQEELKKETLGIVKEMDQIAGRKAHDENEYRTIMNDQFNSYKQQSINKIKEIPTYQDAAIHAAVMVNYLPAIQEFFNNTMFQEHDEELIKQLIQFIQSIPFSNDEVYISNTEQADAVKLYYEKLFIPIQEEIEKYK